MYDLLVHRQNWWVLWSMVSEHLEGLLSWEPILNSQEATVTVRCQSRVCTK